MLLTFGLITEGVTDQAVLKNILIGYFNDPDLTVRELQPTLDATDASQMSTFGGWYNVFLYCQSDYLKGAFEQNDFLIIQIDTDCSHEQHFDVPIQRDEPITTFIQRVQNRFKSVISTQFGADFYELYAQRIIFAVAVDEIECWLLPLYYTDKTQSAVNNCLFKLNQKLSEKDKINPQNKDKRIYQRVSRDFMKAKVFQQTYSKNPSFKFFVEELLIKVPKTAENAQNIEGAS
jgi:Domain of unknown function (DUF4276)